MKMKWQFRLIIGLERCWGSIHFQIHFEFFFQCPWAEFPPLTFRYRNLQIDIIHLLVLLLLYSLSCYYLGALLISPPLMAWEWRTQEHTVQCDVELFQVLILDTKAAVYEQENIRISYIRMRPSNGHWWPVRANFNTFLTKRKTWQ